MAGSASAPARPVPVVAKGVAAAPKPAQEEIMGWFKEAAKAGDATFDNGWFFSTKVGTYGTQRPGTLQISPAGLSATSRYDGETIVPMLFCSSPL